MTSKLTRDRLQEIAEDGFLKHGESKELARMALSAMDSEPVAWLWSRDDERDVSLTPPDDDDDAADAIECGWTATPLHRHAQPAPAYPETLPCPVLLEPGLRFGKGVKTRLVLEAIQRRAEHCSELESMTPEERAEYDAGIEEFKAMLPQPAPVVPDDYQRLRELYHAQEKRLFKIAHCIKGPAFDKYSHSPSQAIDVLEVAIFGEIDACRAAMLQELQKSAGVSNNCRSNEKLQAQHVESLTTIKATPALDSLPKNAESRSGNSLANDTNVVKRLTITLPDTSSKAFWSGTGKTETFHPVTYRRWVKEAIERYCAIARIDVEVK
ncbi:hypothetical protein QRZ37_20490 [Klebsiella michiganensis]|nr:hypothetical protein [Klebsiella michiganensis]MDL4402046.1 hypothetical protein [Klebsiella michiganensis]MDL4533107.1 hypothetical protein [Klebsiella michiganensis]